MAVNPGTAMLAATVCRRYYIDGNSKSEIAESLGLSRFKVARLIDLSVREGIVRFEIQAPDNFDTDLSERLSKACGLRRAVVIDMPGEDHSPRAVRQVLGKAAATYLEATVTENDVLGIGWGRTLSVMSDELSTIARCPVVQLGGMVGSVSENSLELVRRVSAVGGGPAYPLFVPLVVQDARTAASLRSQQDVAEAMRRFDSITIGAVAVGSWDPPDSQLLESLPESQQRMLIEQGVSAEILASLIRADGTVVPDLEERSVALGIDQLRRIPELILVAGGATKVTAVRALIAAGLGTTLITDDYLATALLEGRD